VRFVEVKAGMPPTNFSRGRGLVSVGWRTATGRGRGTVFENYRTKIELVVMIKRHN